MKYIIDISFFIALFLDCDINHPKAKKLLILNDVLSKDIVLNNFVIEETFTILTYKWWKNLSKIFSESLKTFNPIYSSTSIKQYINFYDLVEKKISFADIWVIYDWLSYWCELITFDKQQENFYSTLKSKF